MVHFKVQSEVKPEQAWTPTKKGQNTINSATMLGAIGGYPNWSRSAKKFPPREEVDAHDCAHSLHHLRWDCCNFLFWCDLNIDEVEKGAELFLLLLCAQLQIAQASEACDFIFHSRPTQYKLLQNEININICSIPICTSIFPCLLNYICRLLSPRILKSWLVGQY